MKPALLMVDLQRDFLARSPLDPAAAELVARASNLLATCRERGLPVIHVRLSVTRDPDNRMPHWKAEGRWMCVVGTAGHQAPAAIEPLDTEPVVHKAFFSSFASGVLDGLLRESGADTVLLCGLYLHVCIRATALDAWERGYQVIIVDDAVGSYDPLEAIATRQFLTKRGVRFAAVRTITTLLDGRRPQDEERPPGVEHLPAAVTGHGPVAGRGRGFMHRSPRDIRRIAWAGESAGTDEVSMAVQAARDGRTLLDATTKETRCQWLASLAAVLREESIAGRLARHIAEDVGKPIRQARDEVERCRRLLGAVVGTAGAPLARAFADGSRSRRVPHGVVAAITPWNHPLAIAVGKIAPAVAHGNTVVWKPAPAGTRLALSLLKLMSKAAWPPDVVTLVCGETATAQALMEHPAVDAITLTGGCAAGFHAGRVALLRHIPLQAELGGNNAAIVWTGRDDSRTASLMASAAFGFAGQRCTATRRVIVPRQNLDRFVDAIALASGNLVWGDPVEEATVVGPVVSEDSRRRIAIAVAAAEEAGHRVITPRTQIGGDLDGRGWYVAPTIVVCEDAGAEIVQRESFGPVLVVQPADDWDHALALVDGVEQGLVAALFTDEQERWMDFQRRAHVGILKWNRATADAGVEAPFGGWKASGIGPPEHGPANVEWCTRLQAIYEG